MLLCSSRGGDRKRARDGDRPSGSCSPSRPGRQLRLVFKPQKQERNGVGGMGSTGDLVETGGGNIATGTGCTMPSTSGLMELTCSQVIPTGESSAIGNLMAHPGTKLLSSSTSTACQTTVSSRAPPTQPHQLDIGRSCPITTAVPMPAC